MEQRRKAFLALLDPSDLLPGYAVSNLYTLKQLCLQGSLPDSPKWLRAQAWRVLLGYLPQEKREWKDVLRKRRAEYYVSSSLCHERVLKDRAD